MIIEIKKVISFNKDDNKRFEDTMRLINCMIGKLKSNDAKGLMSSATDEVIPIEDLEKTVHTLSILEEHSCMTIADY